MELEPVFKKYVVGAPHGVGGFHERLDDLRGAGGRVVVVRTYAALGVLELQYVAVFLAVVHDFGVFAIVLFHGVPPAFVEIVALEVFFGLCIAVHANFAVLEIHERDGVGDRLREGWHLSKRGRGERCDEDVVDFHTHTFKIIFFERY